VCTIINEIRSDLGCERTIFPDYQPWTNRIKVDRHELSLSNRPVNVSTNLALSTE